MVDQAHSLNLKIIMDFVPNHSSDLHEWFQKSDSGLLFQKNSECPINQTVARRVSLLRLLCVGGTNRMGRRDSCCSQQLAQQSENISLAVE